MHKLALALVGLVLVTANCTDADTPLRNKSTGCESAIHIEQRSSITTNNNSVTHLPEPAAFPALAIGIAGTTFKLRKKQYARLRL